MACGFWPGNGGASGFTLGEPAFYAYANPQPAGFEDTRVLPDGAYFHKEMGEFILPYEVVRQSSAPEQSILAFCSSVYNAAANLGRWDRKTLERS